MDERRTCTHSIAIGVRDGDADLDALEAFLQDFVDRQGLPAATFLGLNLALEELITNVATHGHADAGAHEVRLRLDHDADELTIRVEDDGRPFNPLEAATPDLEASLDERSVGGLGLVLVRAFVDEWDYRRADGKNVLLLRKRGLESSG